ncbi:MAG: energy-coupling factor transporter transmembrane protein EcfT [Selenomonadaceae bacterium]|nr:energy-coupling factor transporter transmembrane protein EcfT [Selenomonadaceae bacterium]
MMTDITIGQFFPADSILHKLDPRTKIISVFVLIIVIFSAKGTPSYIFLTAVTCATVFISKIPPLMILKSLKPISWIIFFTLLIHFFTHDGEILFELGIFQVTDEGVKFGVEVSLRLVLIIIFSSLLTFTTSPIQLTDGLEKILSPLKIIGVPAHEFAMMMTISLRFIPTLIEELDKIIKAQKSRGVDFESGNLIQRLKSFVPVLVPLFISAFRRADELAMAMEARSYRGGAGRTHFRRLKFERKDFFAAATIILIIAVTVGLRFF